MGTIENDFGKKKKSRKIKTWANLQKRWDFRFENLKLE